jgi:hypothetical protein
VAAPDLRIVRRRRGSVPGALVAASAPIENPQATFKNSVSLSGRTGWQTEAWNLMDQVGELRYYVGWRSNSCSRVRLVASELDPSGLPTGKTTNPRVDAIVKAIGGGSQLTVGQLIKRAVECLTIPGEVWVAILVQPDGSEKWFAFSRDEIRKKGQEVTVMLPDGSDHDLRPGVDVIFRVWNSHPRTAQDADSPVRACLDDLYEIVRTTKTIANAGKSRLIGNGIVFVPQEMSLPRAAGPVAAGQPGGMGLTGLPAVQELQELLFNVAKVAYEDDESFAAMIPIFASVPGEMISKVSHLKFDNEITDTAIKLRNDAIHRLAMGLDVSPERMLGLGSSTNHWSAWQIADTDVQIHIAPVMENLCAAITDQVFRNVLEREGIDPTKYIVWYDASLLTSDPDNTDTATDAYDRGVINAAAYRSYLNLDADAGYDFASLDGWRVWAQDQVSKDPSLFHTFLPLLDTKVQAAVPDPIEPPPPPNGVNAKPGRSDDTNRGSRPVTDKLKPGENQGNRGRRQDVGKREASQAIIEVMVSRALELAGKRRRTRADNDRLRGLKPQHFHRVMEPVNTDDIPELIKGWDDALEADTLALVGLDIEEVRDQVRREVRRQMTAQVVTV